MPVFIIQLAYDSNFHFYICYITILSVVKCNITFANILVPSIYWIITTFMLNILNLQCFSRRLYRQKRLEKCSDIKRWTCQTSWCFRLFLQTWMFKKDGGFSCQIGGIVAIWKYMTKVSIGVNFEMKIFLLFDYLG